MELGVPESFKYLVQYSYAVLPLWVLAEQLGLPIPAAPILLAAGAVAATGSLSLILLIALATGAALTADLFWYHVGRSHGPRALGRLCRLSLEPDSCVRRAQQLLERHGLRSLLVAKFVPGLNAVAAPLAGTAHMSWWRFLLADLLGILIWATSFELLGFAFSRQLEMLVVYVLRAGTLLLVIMVIGALVSYVVRKRVRRQRFLSKLRVARITPAELKEKLDDHEPVTIIDLRHSLDFLPEPYVIPGAIRIPLEELEKRQSEIPRDREVVLYCTCPNEASSAMTATKLRQYGITRVRPLEGGFHGWRDLGLPLESPFEATPPQVQRVKPPGWARGVTSVSSIL
jgi:membrane protein DedA with SNARE-associated domain/rhodanese-related sulfurtransferase